MIHYTDALTTLIADIVERVEPLSFIDVSRLLVFARPGRSDAAGAYATCHSLNLPASDPGYYFWRDRESGRLTRRSECFVTRTPEVWIRDCRIDYLLSFTIPRFCDQTLEASSKACRYPGRASWIAKLDTVVHELYHIAPGEVGLRRIERRDGGRTPGNHGPTFLDDVAGFVRRYLATSPDPSVLEFLRFDFEALRRQYGDVVATTFCNFPSYPQRYQEAVDLHPEGVDAPVEPIRRSSQPSRYTERELEWREFTGRGTRRVEAAALRSAA